MNLNKVRILSEEQLIKAIRENGYEGIANILENKGLNGHSFLECNELQTISWGLSRFQKKSIFNFINEVKSNPAILVKSEYTIRQIKPKPSLPSTPKPSLPSTPKPTLRSTQQKNVNLTLKSNLITSKSSVTKRPQNNADLPVSQYKVSINNVDSNEVKRKISLFSSTQSPSAQFNEINPNFQHPSPSEQNQPFERIRKTARSHPIEPEASENNETSKINKPFLPEPSSKARPPCPLPTKKFEEKLISDGGYLTPTDLDIGNSPTGDENSPKSFLGSTFLHKNKFRGDTDPDDEPDAIYECPPNEQASTCFKHPILPSVESNKSPNISKRPLPNYGIEAQKISPINVKVPVETVDDDDDDEDQPNIYDQVEDQNATNNNPRHMNSLANIKNEQSSNTIQRKYTSDVNVERDKRPLNFLGSLGNIGKYIVDRYKSTRDTSNYENHTFETEHTSHSMNSYSYKDRPLPEIPNTEDFNEIKESESVKNADVTRNLPREPLLHTQDNDAEEEGDDMVYENLKEKTRKLCSYEPDLYENNETVRCSRDKSPLPKHQFLRDSLAHKLSKALKMRDLTMKAESLSNPEPSDEEEQWTYDNIDETDQPEADEPIEEDTDEEQEEYIDSIFDINNEPFFRNIDRKGAKRLLANLTDGAFLFRPSEKYFLVLTIKFNGKFHNLGIERTVDNKIRLNADMKSISPEFGTMRAFVDYFTKEPVTFKENNGNLVEIFLNPVLPVDIF
ncbi:uncharacterized protein LOC130442719 [Diorhabda sublineata]|uniref:uncharacterized protein LOC130442719 n=1 Tax=Diorhabda sublineata TaxID=1163346 RepID=UPI0024E0C3BF|nr:uncharacterized protein LOC130442719 [Diorhabda sublineata]